LDEERLRLEAAESADLQRRYLADKAALVVEIGQRLAEAIRGGGKVLVFGNGGSAADAQHFAAELVGRYQKDRPAWPALALTTDTSVLTSVANDFGYEAVFRRQVEGHGRAGDVAVGITTSGRSPNVVGALARAREMGLVTVAMTGKGGAALSGHVDYLLDVPHVVTARVQEVHGLVIHLLCAVVEEALG